MSNSPAERIEKNLAKLQNTLERMGQIRLASHVQIIREDNAIREKDIELTVDHYLDRITVLEGKDGT